MARINSMDGVYFLAGSLYAGDEPPVPDESGRAKADIDCLGVSTYAQWATIDILLEVSTEEDARPIVDRTQSHEGWDSASRGRLTATEPLWLSTMEFEPCGKRPAIPMPGEYEWQLLARRAESVKVYWPGPIKKGEEVTEEHYLVLRRLSDAEQQLQPQEPERPEAEPLVVEDEWWAESGEPPEGYAAPTDIYSVEYVHLREPEAGSQVVGAFSHPADAERLLRRLEDAGSYVSLRINHIRVHRRFEDWEWDQ